MVPVIQKDNRQLKSENSSETDFEKNEQPSQFITVYTDGACTRNGTPLARAGIGAYFNDQQILNISRPAIGRQTNNAAEIQAANAAAQQAHQAGVKKLLIRTDSKFLLNSVQQWTPVWKERGWIPSRGKPVTNKADFETLDEALKPFEEVC